jgi:hypothetical protein
MSPISILNQVQQSEGIAMKTKALLTRSSVLLSGLLGLTAAQANDTLVINSGAGGPSITLTSIEGTGPEFLAFNPGILSDPAISLTNIIVAGGRVVALLEPVGEPVNPNEPPCVQLDGGPPGSPQGCISDIVAYISSAVGPPNVAMWSDPNLLLGASAIATLAGPGSVIFEDGTLQDLSLLLGVPAPGSVFARSDVVPVPAAVWLFGSALGLMGVVRRKITA